MFCKTRGCNYKFYEWYNTTILLEFIKSLKHKYEYEDDVVTWFQLDGEAKQIEIYEKKQSSKNYKIIVLL